MKKPKVFVAMAFDHEDTDTFYEKAVVPAIKNAGGTPVRVDQKKEFGFLNVKIIRLMEESDAALVDLTYERPSVYYEAGFFHGKGKNVVFSVRADHLDRNVTGNRVHFDVEQREIEPWNSCNLEIARQSIESRITQCLKPILLENKQIENRKLERERFMSSGVDYRKHYIVQELLGSLKKYGYLLASHSGSLDLLYSEYQVKPLLFVNALMQSAYQVQYISSSKLKSKLHWTMNKPRLLVEEYRYGYNCQNALSIVSVIVSEDSIDIKRVMPLFPRLHKITSNFLKEDFPYTKPMTLPQERVDGIYICDNIRSLSDLSERLEDLYKTTQMDMSRRVTERKRLWNSENG